MRCLVTGAAGFIGSHLSERLLADGHAVVGLDCFTPYYPRSVKVRNLADCRKTRHFEFVECDLVGDSLAGVVDGVEWIFHLAAMPGLTRSWTHFDEYQRCNLTATQRLLEAVKGSPCLNKLIYASTSSVYGKYASGDESLPTQPSSPYGVTKLAGEHLARIYADEFQVPAVILRYFSVYGPRQRPEMGYHLFIDAIRNGTPIFLTGDGLHVRGNTFVSDCVEATMRAVDAPTGEIYNLGGGELVTVIDAIRKIEKLVGKPAIIERKPPRPGDQMQTAADVTKLASLTGWKPAIGVDEGLARQVQWQSQ